MQHDAPACQLGRANDVDSRQKSTPKVGTQCLRTVPWTPVSATAMEVDTTDARHTGPRNWLRSVEWLIAAGLHPKANQTTLAVAQDLARRMDYSTGHVRYDLEGTAQRLDIHRSNVARHVGYLRQLGALVWAQRGTRRNIRRVLGLPGYAATATVYAATIPAVYDDALGHQVIGSGYGARIVRDYRRMPVDNASSAPVDNPGKRSCATPSLTSADVVDQVQMVGGVTTTAGRSPKTSTAPSTPNTASSSKKRTTILGATITAAGMRVGDKLARAIRRRAPWTRNATHDQLRWACADMGEQQWTEDQAVRFIAEAGFLHTTSTWTPDRPHHLIAGALRAHVADAQARAEREALPIVAWEDSTAGKEAARLAGLADLFGPAEPEPTRTDEDRARARLDWNNWPDVAHHYATDPDDALDLYGIRLCTYAIRQDSKTRNQQEVWA